MTTGKDPDLVNLEQRLIDRIDSMCSDRPTWQRSPVVEHDLMTGFIQIIRDEFRRAQNHIKSKHGHECVPDRT